LEQAEEALTSADALVAPAEDFAPLRERLAQSHADRRREAEAVQAAADAEARKRREFEGHLSEAAQHLTRGNLTKAIVIADLALGLDPEHPAARTLQADIQRAIEAQKEAERRVARLMAAAQAAVDRQRFQEAAEALEQLRAIAPNTAGLEHLSGVVHAGLEAQRAAELARHETERERRALDEMLARAAKRQRRRDYATALGLIDDVLARDSQHAEALSLRDQVQRAIEERAAHPDTGFSLRPTLSAANVWLRTKSIYSNTFRISVGLILAAAAAIGVWSGPAEQPPAAPAQTSSSPAPIQTPPAGVAMESVKPEPQVPPPATNRNEVAVSAESAARRQLEAGNPQEALRSLRPGLAIDSTDAGLLALLLKIEADAQSRASNAERAADKAGSVALSSPAFADAKRSLQEAERLRDLGRHEAAIRRYWDTARLFGEAAATKPPRPAAPSPEATTSVPAVVATATAAVDGTRQRYEAAFEARSIEELRAVWPSMPRAVQKAVSDHFKDARSVVLDLQCQQPVFADLQRGQSGRRPTAVLSCYEKREVLSPAGGVRVQTAEPVTIYLRAEGQVWVITDVTSQLFRQ
jgi:tetratricopeptide (TPR) repeat protein